MFGRANLNDVGVGYVDIVKLLLKFLPPSLRILYVLFFFFFKFYIAWY